MSNGPDNIVQFRNNREVPTPPPSRDWIFRHDATREPV
jgi:hypothetical protein